MSAIRCLSPRVDACAPALDPSSELPADGTCPEMYLPGDEDGDGDGDGVADTCMRVWDGGG